MKISQHRIARQMGSVLMVTLFIATLFGLFLYSYLHLVRQQRNLVARSQAWNTAFSMAEAGVEEALAQLNPSVPQMTLDLSLNGWGQPVGGAYGPVSRSLPGGTYTVLYTADTLPVIYATGYVSVPSIPANLTRALRVATTNVPLFTAGMSARGDININGNNVTTDSFNSTDPNLSNNGRYDPTRTSTNGDIASAGGIVDVGNGDINGSVYLGPGAMDSLLSNGTITGRTYNDFNFDFPDVGLPNTTWLPAVGTNVTVDGVTYQYYLSGTGDYTIDSLSSSVYVAPDARIRLLLTGNASPPAIRVAGVGPDAGRLTIFMTGQSFSMSGNYIVDGGDALGFSYYGTPANTDISLTGNASFTGTIYAPSAALRLGGGGQDTYDLVGATVSQTVTMNGHFNFHYDEALLRLGPMRGYAPNSWTELYAWREL